MTSLETSPAAFVLSLFGPMQVFVNGQPLPRLRSRKTLSLLALLALRPARPVEREWLASTLWPDADPERAAASLRPVLSELRRALGEQNGRVYSPTYQTLCLDVAGAVVDVLEFDAAIADSALPSLERAAALYRGPLLEDSAEEWVGQERAVREQDCLRALEILAAAALTSGDYTKAADYSRRAVALDPWRDASQRGLMEALARGGDRNAALQVYREFVQLLRSDPKAAPDEETSALYTRLRAEARRRGQAPVKAVAPKADGQEAGVAGHLPHPLTDLVGREDESMEVAARLRRFRLVTLTGPGGIGKTRLALAVAAEAAPEYPDGAWMVALEALSDGRLVVPQIAAALGLRETSGKTPLEGLADHLRAKRLLLVLDNCEHLLAASAQAAGYLLRECPGLCILSTSREALAITGETVWGVPGLAVPPPDYSPAAPATPQGDLMNYGSVQLFVERAQAVQRQFLLAENAQAVAEVCTRLEGIPLAIELAAARVRVLTATQIASRLGDYLSLLAGGGRDVPARQQALRATLDWSYTLLNAQEQLLLRRLSVFSGDWTLEAAEVVGSENGIEAGRVFDLLTSLVDKSLVVFAAREKTDRRYRLLEATHQYAAGHLESAGETAPVRSRHRDYFLALAEEAVALLTGPDQGIQMARLEAERENLRAALAWCGAEPEGAETELRLASALWQFWWVRGDYGEGRRLLARALERKGAGTAARAPALQAAGSLAYGQADLAAAQSLYRESLDAHRQLGDRTGMAEASGGLGNTARDQGDYAAARGHYEESLSLFREMGHRHGVAWSLGNLGSVLLPQGELAAARVFYEESLDLYRALGDERGVAWSLSGLSDIAYDQGDVASARAMVQECVTIRRALGNKPDIAWSLDALGKVTRNEGDYAVARGHYEESLALFREMGDHRGVAWSLKSLGDVAYDQDDLAGAQTLYAESLGIRRTLKNKPDIAWSLDALGRVACAQGDTEAAHARYRESLLLFGEVGDVRGVARSLEGTAAVMLARGEGRKAVRLWGTAQAVRDRIGSPLPPKDRAIYERRLDEARRLLGADSFAAAWETGCSLPWKQAVRNVLEEDEQKQE